MIENNAMLVKDSDPDSPIAADILKPVVDELKQFALGYPDLKLKERPTFIPNPTLNSDRELFVTEPLSCMCSTIAGTIRLIKIKERNKNV